MLTINSRSLEADLPTVSKSEDYFRVAADHLHASSFDLVKAHGAHTRSPPNEPKGEEQKAVSGYEQEPGCERDETTVRGKQVHHIFIRLEQTWRSR